MTEANFGKRALTVISTQAEVCCGAEPKLIGCP